MKSRIILGLLGFLMALIICSCSQQPSKGKTQIDHDKQYPKSNTGLRIDNGINRGISYTDSFGNNYNLRYIPIISTNDSTTSIHLQIAFSKEYDYPTAYGDEQFKVIPLPKEWALDGVEITESMINVLPQYINQPFFDKTLKPGEKCIMAIGTLYPRPTKGSGILPNTLFTHNKRGDFPACDWFMKKDLPSNSQIALGLKLNFGESCMIIPCGQISYPESN